MTIGTSMSSWNMPKAVPEDMLIRITVCNRGPEPAELHVLPTLWFRNDWSAWIAGRCREADAQADRGTGGYERDCSDAPCTGYVLPVR